MSAPAAPNGHRPKFRDLFTHHPKDGTVHVYNLRMTEGQPGTLLLWSAAALLLLLAAAQGYVSWRAQFAFINAAEHDVHASIFEALGLDTGAVIFALLGLAHARMGRPARVERTLNVACALGSAAMNVLAADLASPRSVAVYVMPAVLYAACSDRLIATATHTAGVEPVSVWRWTGTVLLYLLRTVPAAPSTLAGLRRWVLAAAPVPGPDSAPEPPRTPAASKKARLLELYAKHHGRRERVSAAAAELAPLAGLQSGTARTYLYAHVDGSSS